MVIVQLKNLLLAVFTGTIRFYKPSLCIIIVISGFSVRSGFAAYPRIRMIGIGSHLCFGQTRLQTG